MIKDKDDYDINSDDIDYLEEDKDRHENYSEITADYNRRWNEGY